MERIKLGVSIDKDGKQADILAVVEETDEGIKISGGTPFGGKPISFLPMPEGFKGTTLVHKQTSLSTIVEAEESVVFRMGSLPTCYYQYKDGYCYGYYDIERIDGEPE